MHQLGGNLLQRHAMYMGIDSIMASIIPRLELPRRSTSKTRTLVIVDDALCSLFLRDTTSYVHPQHPVVVL
jgi:hypothetical protein